MISQRWIEKTRATLEITKPGPERDALVDELAAAEKANADARAKHLRVGGHPAGDDVTVCLHCNHWARPGAPIVHSGRCPEHDNREAQPIVDPNRRLQKAERKALDSLARG